VRHEETPESEQDTVAVVRPKIIVLCGSTRFTQTMLDVAWQLTKEGNIVIHWNVLPDGAGAHGAEQEGVKELVDELYKRKIDLADEVLVLNVGGYIGKSTRSEIDYALAHDKPVRWLEPPTEVANVR